MMGNAGSLEAVLVNQKKKHIFFHFDSCKTLPMLGHLSFQYQLWTSRPLRVTKQQN